MSSLEGIMKSLLKGQVAHDHGFQQSSEIPMRNSIFGETRTCRLHSFICIIQIVFLFEGTRQHS